MLLISFVLAMQLTLTTLRLKTLHAMKFKITKGVSCEHFEICFRFWGNVTIFDMEILKYCKKKKKERNSNSNNNKGWNDRVEIFPKFFNNAIPPKFFPSTIPFKFFLYKMYRDDARSMQHEASTAFDRSKEKSYL